MTAYLVVVLTVMYFKCLMLFICSIIKVLLALYLIRLQVNDRSQHLLWHLPTE